MSTRFAVLGVACLSFALSGCGLDQHPAYSAKVKYGVRTDPVFVGTGKELGDERFDVDSPGVLPLLSIKDIDKPNHPYAAKKSDALKWLRDPALLSSANYQELEAVLEELFGTPAQPIVNAKAGKVDAKAVSDLQISDEALSKGSRLYRVHCLHCHGVTGDGRGPTAKWINPHPRDFRRGQFKFISVDAKGAVEIAPSRTDLLRTLRQGLEGTAMPTFALLKDEELDQIVSYVIHLSIRGQVEYKLFDPKEEGFVEKDGALVWSNKTESITKAAKGWLEHFARFWHDSHGADKAIKVVKYDVKDLAASMARGQQIFTANPSSAFIKSHAMRDFSAMQVRVNLAAALDKKKAAVKKANPKLTDDEIDDMNLKLDEREIAAASVFSDADRKEIEQKASDPEVLKRSESFLKGGGCVSCHNNYGRQSLYRFDVWGTLAKPNNLTLGVFRGGRRPVDIYYRIHGGINPSGMTPFGSVFKGNEDYIWDLVNFVSNVQYPAMRKQLPVIID